MVIAFLDLLGFSQLIDNDVEVAYDNLENFNRAIKTRITDNLTNPIDKYEYELKDFVENQLITSFKHMISISDSLIIGSEKPDLFLVQICCFVACLFIEYSKPFEKTITNLKDVKSDKVFTLDASGNINAHSCFPIMFRGGISFGKDVIFSPELYIADIDKEGKDAYKYGLNVCGKSYVDAVYLERTGKGPRLFCNYKFVDILSDNSKKVIRVIDKEKGLYEIIWTYYACEVFECSTNKMSNATKLINNILLPRVINLYKYYENDEKNKDHYLEFIKLSCRGIIKYAKENNLDINLVKKQIEAKLQHIDLYNWTLEGDDSEFLL